MKRGDADMVQPLLGIPDCFVRHARTNALLPLLTSALPFPSPTLMPTPPPLPVDESDGCGAKFSVLVVSNKFVGMPLIDRQVGTLHTASRLPHAPPTYLAAASFFMT